ncbi:hypothetical protein [Telmatospirillum sp.]|uniref:hypothetical protein n=1 Tax=Telmatospirillum sp. TaxID=2079197 RepID=UPI00283FBC54|nr:hypothetical protein [Telmatospirillum sp.]MDR3436562.1 hypothetical protein [Telmatospirillum sp.]
MTHFKASVLNNFRLGVSSKRFDDICRQIDWAIGLGASTIRINDSVGGLQPHLTHELCGELVQRYPTITFCLHAHNDNGLAVANTMAAIQSGFQMIEGSLAGFGNRSGIAPIEQVVKLCQNNNITLGAQAIDLAKLVECARQSERTFGAIPNLYRPVSGIFETDSNFGVLNIPDFLETNDEKRYFVNYAGLHPVTLKMALSRHAQSIDVKDLTDDVLWDVVRKLQNEIESSDETVTQDYNKMLGTIDEFYGRHVITTKSIADRVVSLLGKETAIA